MNIAILIPELGGGGAERIAQIVGDYYFGRGENVYYFLGHDFQITSHIPRPTVDISKFSTFFRTRDYTE